MGLADDASSRIDAKVHGTGSSAPPPETIDFAAVGATGRSGLRCVSRRTVQEQTLIEDSLQKTFYKNFLQKQERLSMPHLQFDNAPEAWQPVADDTASYRLCYDFQVLSWDVDAQTIDFVLRFDGDGGHCPRHRHLAATTVLVMSGEQHLDEWHPDGTTTHKCRVSGEYHRSDGADANPHMERGGDAGAVVFYSCYAPDRRLFEFVDDDRVVTRTVTTDDMIHSWQSFKDEMPSAAGSVGG